MRIADIRVRGLIRQILREQDDASEDCVLSNFERFKDLGKDEQVSLYAAFKDCVDTSFVNSDNLQIVHWYNLYEGNPVTLLKDFIAWLNKHKLKISGSLSAVGYTNFASQVAKVLSGRIGFILGGPVGLAFKRDAETERGGQTQYKMPGKIEGGSSLSGGVKAWIPYMILDAESYSLHAPGTDTPNEFIMVNPKIKGIILDIEWLKEEVATMGVSSKGTSINDLMSTMAKIILALNVRVVNLQGQDIKGELQAFTSAEAGDIKSDIIQTLIGEKELSDANPSDGSAPTRQDLLANFTTLDQIPQNYPGAEMLYSDHLVAIMKKLNDEGRLGSIIQPVKRDKPVDIGFDSQRPVARKTYYDAAGGEGRLYPEDLIRKFLDGTPVYYQKIMPYFNNPEHPDYRMWGWALEEMPWLKDVQHFARWLDMRDYNGSKMNSSVKDTLIPWMAVAEYDGTLPVPPPVPPDEDSKFVAKLSDGSTVSLKKKAGKTWYLLDDLIKDALSLTDSLEPA